MAIIGTRIAGTVRLKRRIRQDSKRTGIMHAHRRKETTKKEFLALSATEQGPGRIGIASNTQHKTREPGQAIAVTEVARIGAECEQEAVMKGEKISAGKRVVQIEGQEIINLISGTYRLTA